MCGILCPTSGEVYVNGLDVYKNRKKVNKERGVDFDKKTQLWWDIPLIETFEILKSIYDISDEDYNERFEYLKKLLDLDEFLNQNVRSLSLGQRMRADFAASLIHNPKILFLDEPTIGLDVLVKSNIRKAIKELNKKYNTTVILTTHDMSDIEELCSRIIIIDKGSILYDGSLTDIKYQFGNTKTIIFNIDENFDDTKLREYSEKLSISVEDNICSVKFSLNEIELDPLLMFLIKVYKIQDFKILDIGIEEISKKLYEDNKKN